MITQIDGFNFVKRKTKKTQIVLCNTQRPYKAYISSLLFRRNRTNDKVPHFVVTKSGDIYSLFPTEYYSKLIPNKNAIVIAVENLGWLQKHTISPMYLNWIGDVFRGQAHVAPWRERFFWDPYQDEQVAALGGLIRDLCKQYGIPKTYLAHSAVHSGQINKIPGIVSRSNYDDIYTDIGPAFNWTDLGKIINHEPKKTHSKQLHNDAGSPEQRPEASGTD